MGWFAINILNIVPVTRKGGEANPLTRCEQALRDNKILIFSRRNARRTGNIIAAEIRNLAFEPARAGGERGPRLAMRHRANHGEGEPHPAPALY